MYDIYEVSVKSFSVQACSVQSISNMLCISLGLNMNLRLYATVLAVSKSDVICISILCCIHSCYKQELQTSYNLLKCMYCITLYYKGLQMLQELYFRLKF